MFRLVKSNFIYTFQNKFNLAMQIIMIISIAVVPSLYSYRYSMATNYSDLPDLPLSLFLFVSTFLLVSSPMVAPKQYSNSDYGVFMLSFPISKREFVTGYYLKLLIYMGVTLIDIYFILLITMTIRGIPIKGPFFLLIFFIVLYTVGVMGALYLLFYFSTKFFKPIIFALYFMCFFSITYFLNINLIFCSDYMDALLYIGILFIPFSYILSLITAKRKDF